jgi:hypothetical protein
MALAITPFTDDLVPAVKAFNARLLAGGVFHEFQFHESPTCAWLPKRENRRIYQEYFVATEDGVVRGGYVLKHQPFSCRGEVQNLPFYHGPISEGLFNKKYASVGALLTRHAVKTQPLLFALGMGGWEQPLPRMLQAMRWKMFEVPFYFYVARPFRFLRQIRPLRNTVLKTAAAEAGAWTGAGWAGLRTVHALRRRTPAHASGATVEAVADFGEWADPLWESCHDRYSLVALRNRETLNILYPPESPQFVRLVVRGDGKTLGWAVLLDTAMRDHKYFGDLRVGSIVDCFGDPEHAAVVVAKVLAYLRARGVDLIVSNQSHRAWGDGLRAAGFLQGPSNFLFAASPQLAARLDPFDTNQNQLHFNRGDGDGPIHL